MTDTARVTHDALMQSVSHALLDRQWQVATAESCTAGLIGATLTDSPGSSAWFDRGFITYSNEAKQAMLGVTPADLDHYGAVSEPVVTQMAAGALQHSLADITVAVSGVAGPDGGSAEKPVGTVWLGWAFARQVTAGLDTANATQRLDDGAACCALRMHFSGDRISVRELAVEAALRGIMQLATGQLPMADTFFANAHRG